MRGSVPWWGRRAALLLLLVALAHCAPWGAAADEFKLEPAYPAIPLKGPEVAKGAVLWNHGVNFLLGTEGYKAPLPAYLLLFREAGWDVFRLLRSRMSEEPRGSSAEIAKTAEQLKQQGYRSIVLAGQSGGAWLSLMAASRNDDIHAVIADAPAWYGTDHPTYLQNGFILMDHIDDIRRGRIMIGYFHGDPYDPGGRGAKSEELLAQHGVPHLILDRPAGFSGHFSGNTGRYARRFGACLLAVAGDGPMPTAASCDSGWGREPSAALPVPKDLTLAKPSGGPADPFLGAWYGTYAIGRELMLAVTRVDGTSVEADYIVGPGLAPQQKAAVTRRDGTIADGTLVFAAEGASTLRFTPRDDGDLDAHWISADGTSQLAALLHRVR
jgi:dienelactone hydrolase